MLETLSSMDRGIEYYIELNFLRWPGDGGSMKNWYKQLANIERFLTARTGYMLSQLEDRFGEKLHQVKVKSDREGVTWTINDVSSEDSSDVRNFRHRKTVTIDVQAPEGYIVKAMRVHLSEKNIKLIEGNSFQGLINSDWKIEIFTAPAN